MATKKRLPIGRGKIGYTTSNTFRQPLKKVWEAATSAKLLKGYFVDKVIGEFGPDLKPVTWAWNKAGEAELNVTRYEKEKLIEFTSSVTGKYQTTVTFEFVRKGNITIFRVHDKGYSAADLRLAFMMCEGWSEFHSYMKAYLRFGVDVSRKG